MLSSALAHGAGAPTQHSRVTSAQHASSRTPAPAAYARHTRRGRLEWAKTPARGGLHVHAAGALAAPVMAPPPAITLTDAALAHLKRLRDDSGSDKLLLRMGVKSGMSYHMDFEDEGNVREEDAVMEYEGGFRLVCDPKSLLYLFGMELDWSSALVGGGFQFRNPNAAASCGCGKSFGV